MQWADLRTHGDTPHRAFEALCSLLFERWCRSTFPDRLRSFHVTGAGGDGGVESLARLDDATAIGLQCKWFRDPLGAAQITQIRHSLDTAASVRGGLTRYIVAIPRNLGDRPDSNAERQKWSQFADDARARHPLITIELWDEHRLEALLAQFGGEGIRRYWFAEAAVEESRLGRLFSQARAGWLSARYSPDLHQAGEIEAHVELRANRRPLPLAWRLACERQRRLASKAATALAQLDHIAEIANTPELEAAKQELTRLAAYLDQLDLRLKAAPTPSVNIRLEEPTFDITPLVRRLKSTTPDHPNWPQRDALKKLADEWDRHEPLVPELQRLERPALFTAGPGAGKTHACAAIVENALSRNEPALLIRARDFVPGQHSWVSILRQCLEEPNLSLEELLDALVASARAVDVRRASVEVGAEVHDPCLPIILIDGLDESRGAHEWLVRLSELPASLANRRIVFAATCRASLLSEAMGTLGFSIQSVKQSDPDLGSVFSAYMNDSGIDAPPVIRWWLRTPLEIRLFADVFKNAPRSAFANLQLGIHELVRLKLDLVAEAVAQSLSVTLSIARPVIKERLIGFADELLKGNGRVSNENTLRCFRGISDGIGNGAMVVLQVLRDRGILLEIPSRDIDPLRDPGPSWDFAFETLHSYIVATRYAESPSLEALSYLRQHPQALIFSIVLRENLQNEMFMSADWAATLPQQMVTMVRLTALSLMDRQRSSRYESYVKSQLCKSALACRAVITHLVIPGLRIPQYGYGAIFVHEVIRDLSVAERDKFWSYPGVFDSETDRPWGIPEGATFNSSQIVEDDQWSTAPLLLLLSCASVTGSYRRSVVEQLGYWGARRPNELGTLVRLVFEEVNDPQVLEDTSAVVWAASCVNPDADWSNVRALVMSAQWKRAFPAIPSLRFVRYCELFISLVDKKEAAIPLAIPDTLSLDRDVGGTIETETGFGPIRGDLSWYVVPQALSDFAHDEKWGDDAGENEWHDNDQWSKHKVELLTAFAEGRIRPGSPAAVIAEARAFLDELEMRARERAAAVGGAPKRANSMWRALRVETTDSTMGADRTQLDEGEEDEGEEDEGEEDEGEEDEGEEDEGEEDEGEEDEGEENEGEDHEEHEGHDGATKAGGGRESLLRRSYELKDTPWRSELERVLALHATQNGYESLTLNALGYGYVMARAAEFGWTTEYEAADLQIEQEYGHETHGARSPVCSFFEKYLWLALGELRAFLSYRLSRADPRRRLAPDRLEDVDNPIDQRDSATCLLVAAHWNNLIEPSTLREKWAQQRANEWVQEAAPVDIGNMFILSARDVRVPEDVGSQPFASSNGRTEWIALDGYLDIEEIQSQSERLVWLSSLLVESSELALVEEDARADLFLQRHDLTDVTAGLARKGSYVGPFEALWMTTAELRSPVPHTTLIVEGEKLYVREILMYPAVAESTWHDTRARTFSYPIKMLREGLGITRYRHGCFLRADHSIVAVNAVLENENDDDDDRGWNPPTGHMLLVRKDLLTEVLAKLDIALIVSMAAKTQPSGHLWRDAAVGWDRIEQHAIVGLTANELREPVELAERTRGPEYRGLPRVRIR